MLALEAARSAQRQWARTPLKERFAFWRAFNDVLRVRAGEFPLLRTTHLQGISIATSVTPRRAVFDSAALPPAEGATW
jgi:acyl-CoA reductase-like NAD-dependent aldehyde dehydrogenase